MNDACYLGLSLAWSLACLLIGGLLGYLLAILREKTR